MFTVLSFLISISFQKKQTLRPKSIYRREMEHGRKKTNKYVLTVQRIHIATEKIWQFNIIYIWVIIKIIIIYLKIKC